MNIKEHLFENGSLYVLVIATITFIAVANYQLTKEEFKAPTKKTRPVRDTNSQSKSADARKWKIQRCNRGRSN